ncbi:hypothetical protein LEP1GSC202_3299 [Leptospira yanagawae serovar Saopaulo str. Sao Paulo = ATCC 700523]|uniref:Uncharacterized protein n=1 Tax=Leptospira yanagawae serovar Saopaulo str. Sao Paulo = ATCC 700523 TaxID=1249483 RepID=A0A5E8HD40_9LEPT|nr:hypothetical protein LEP1GSC202_3299 [Leptospira yanagawae serovar Saopaulo str. Sao Paulo = ATCC 700523]
MVSRDKNHVFVYKMSLSGILDENVIIFLKREVEEGIECLQLTSSSVLEEKTKRKELNLLP